MYLNQFGPYYYDLYRMPNDSQLVNDIQKAINGEYSAIACYKELAKMAPSNDERDRIMEIRKDEVRHLEEFSRIYTNLTGKNPSYQLIEKCPNTYKAGLEFAFKDEQETVDFYLEISDKAQDPNIKERFRRSAADEQKHAVWFLSFFNHPKGTNINRQINNYGAKGALSASILTLPQMLTYSLLDEYLAQARYDDILRNFGYNRSFTQIKEAEKGHINALIPLFQRYQVPLPEDLSQAFVTTPESIKAAYAAGVQGEIDNISMYDRFLSLTLPNDVRTVFSQLRKASLNHLAVFEKGLER